MSVQRRVVIKSANGGIVGTAYMRVQHRPPFTADIEDAVDLLGRPLVNTQGIYDIEFINEPERLIVMPRRAQ